MLNNAQADEQKKVDDKFGLDPTIFVGMVRMPGLTAYLPYDFISKTKKSDTMFVSAAPALSS